MGAPLVRYVDPEDGVPVGEGTVTLVMKGGGSENMSRQYSLPDAGLGAGRDLDGARKCILDAVVRAQGYGCAPGILGVCIGGDRATGYEVAKEQLLRPLDEPSGKGRLAALERRVLKEANSLGIGPMGLGGKTTLLGVKIASRTRVPASFFVTVAYMCWACRRQTIEM
jgi:fumarate hydratase class I